MYWWSVNIAVVLVVVSLEGVYLQDIHVENALLELLNYCKCVNYQICDENNCIVTNGSTTLMRRINAPNAAIKRIPCLGSTFPNEIVCCKLQCNNTVTSTEAATVTTTSKPLDRNPAGETGVNVADERTCGVQKTIIDTRIHKGDDDLNPSDGEFPWIAAIFKKTTSGRYKFLCSGSLIHPNVVLTVNHCIHNKRSSDLRVVVNGKIKLSEADAAPDDKRDVSEVRAHPKYNDRLLFNDAALLMLEMPYVVETWSRINVLCLPPKSFKLDGKKCLVVGWGDDNSGQRSKSLKKVEVPFVNHSECQTLLRRTKLRSSFNLDKSFLCAGGEKGRDACVGDGGSPLMCTTQVGSEYFLAGMVSWGVDCGKEDVPGVYTDVADISEWIENEFDNRQLNF